jgi:CO/xanthine dehydrogenase Mo-binding subunit
MTKTINLSRRDVLNVGAGASALLLGFHTGFRGFPVAQAAEGASFEPNVYVRIDNTGLVTIIAHRSEMGTGIRTGLPAVLADELEADWSRVDVVQAPGDPRYGDQNTDGSRSMRQLEQFRRLSGRAHGHHAGDARPSHRQQRAARGRRRAGRAADCAGALQRDLRRDREAHPLAPDRLERPQGLT